MNHASLFTGIGGFDLAAQWMNWNNIFQVEKDEFCLQVLQKNFPTTKRFNDVKKFKGQKYRGEIDVLTGGFPCQPFSIAGKRNGKNDDRFLWPENFRIIRELQPIAFVGENVPGIESMENGAIFEQICDEMESEGFAVQPFNISAASVEAIHKRARIWFIAYHEGRANRQYNRIQKERSKHEFGEGVSLGNASDPLRVDGRKIFNERRVSKLRPESFKYGEERAVANAEPSGIQKRYPAAFPISAGQSGRLGNPRELLRTTFSPVCRADDGISPELDRRKRLKALGNAIVPQVAYEIFSHIENYFYTGLDQ